MSMQWTGEQARAIDARGGNLLLSAAAGSGKTTVLVARVMKLIEEGAGIDRMLVVTFTNAAASDMRAKLSRKLAEAAAAGDARCREQMIALERASITTLHAFCADFLRTNFERAGVDPAFRILDDAIRRQLMDAALDEAFEEAYAKIDSDEALRRLDYGRGPKNVRALVESLVGILEERPDPDAWLARAEDVEALIPEWRDELKNGARRAIESALVSAQEALDTPDCPANYARALEADIQALSAIRQIDEYDPMMRAIEEFSPKSAAGGKRGEAPDAAVLERVKQLRTQVKSALKGIRMLKHPLNQAMTDARALSEQIHMLGILALRVRERFEEKKAEQSGLTYSDLETRTLRALKDDSVAEGIRERFDYVFIDEYQDTSDIQEAIVSRIARADNRFMVGDVKQSIYRFRMAEPRLFIEKFNRYRAGDGGTLIPLTRNFRSKRAILDFVNGVFEKIMTGGDSEIVYDELARLNAGNPDDEPGEKPEIHILETMLRAETEDEIAEMKSAEREGLFIAHKIREMMDADPTLRYRDFAILTRAKSSAFTPMLPVLLAENIPAYADGAAGYFESLEISLATALLKLIANRRSDVELIAILHSPVVGLNAEELARIRIRNRNTAFVDAAWMYAFGAEMPERGMGEADSVGERLRAFFDRLEIWRLRAGTMSLGELVRSVLDESGFYVYAGALPGGAQRQANLDRLASDAARFDSEISGSLSRYLKHAENLRARGDGDAAHLLGENDDVVRLMTIHKSKGLEFRVVFGALMGKKFASSRPTDLTAHRDLGMGIYLYDPKLRTRRITLPQSAIQERTSREDAAEEMRVLYVLLTRARERLILVGSVRDAARAQRRFDALSRSPGAGESYLEWMMAARGCAEKAGQGLNSEVYVHHVHELSASKPETHDPRAQFDAIMRSPEAFADPEILSALEWTYPNEKDSGKPLKLTVSGMLREVEGPEALPERIERPQFMAEETPGSMTAAERGTAVHRAMQLIDLSAVRGLSGKELERAIAETLDAAANRKRMTAAQREAVRPRTIARFLESELGVRLRNAETVKREWPFNVRMRAGEALTDAEAGRYGDEEILVQGTIDCCFIENGKWILLDYKTDRADDPEAVRAHYQKQVNAYALALFRITDVPVAEKYLCLLNANRTIPV